MLRIKAITVTMVSPMSNHAANRGEKLLGNLTSIKQRPDDRVYISGQMQRNALFSAIDRLNENKADTYVANGDGANFNDMKHDLRSDMGGYMRPKGKRRTSPISATPALAKEPSSIGRDLLVRLKKNPKGDADQKQGLATNSFSQYDEMIMSFHLDIANLGVEKEYTYKDEKDQETHIRTHLTNHIEQNEHFRRVKLFLEATGFLTDYANQARNATTGEPQKVLIVLDTMMSRKAARYYAPETNEHEKINILAELKKRNAKYFIGDDTKPVDENNDSVHLAYEKAMQELSLEILYWPMST